MIQCSRINPGIRYKDIYRGTSVTRPIKIKKKWHIIYAKNRCFGLLTLTICAPGFNLVQIQYRIYYDFI